MTDYSDLSEHDKEAVDNFEDNLEMMFKLAERWNITAIEAGVWLEDHGYM